MSGQKVHVVGKPSNEPTTSHRKRRFRLSVQRCTRIRCLADESALRQPSALWVDLMQKTTTPNSQPQTEQSSWLGEALKKWRIGRGLSRREMAVLLEIEEEYLLFIECGLLTPPKSLSYERLMMSAT